MTPQELKNMAARHQAFAEVHRDGSVTLSPHEGRRLLFLCRVYEEHGPGSHEALCLNVEHAAACLADGTDWCECDRCAAYNAEASLPHRVITVATTSAFCDQRDFDNRDLAEAYASQQSKLSCVTDITIIPLH
jgi:hypothetical protein